MLAKRKEEKEEEGKKIKKKKKKNPGFLLAEEGKMRHFSLFSTTFFIILHQLN